MEKNDKVIVEKEQLKEEANNQNELENLVHDEEETEEVEKTEAILDETDEEQAELSEEESAITTLQKEVEELQKTIQDQENKYFRVLADYDNLKRRSSLDMEAIQKYRAQEVLTNLIPVLDNFERALSVKAESEEAKSMMEGMEMIYRSLIEALKIEGLTEIEAENKPFDPNFHQAVMTAKDDEKESGIVLEEMQKGYMLKDRVLRPSMVKVNE